MKTILFIALTLVFSNVESIQSSEKPVQGFLFSGDEMVAAVKLTENQQDKLTLIVDKTSSPQKIDSIMKVYELHDYLLNDTIKKIVVDVERIIHVTDSTIDADFIPINLKVKRVKDQFTLRVKAEEKADKTEVVKEIKRMPLYVERYWCQSKNYYSKDKKDCEEYCGGGCVKRTF